MHRYNRAFGRRCQLLREPSLLRIVSFAPSDEIAFGVEDDEFPRSDVLAVIGALPSEELLPAIGIPGAILMIASDRNDPVEYCAEGLSEAVANL